MHCSPPVRCARDKIVPLGRLVRLARSAQRRGRRVVFTNGCFDLLHAGHISLLERAKRLGELLVVGTNSDRSVRGLKGRQRPLVGERDRALVLAALACVDYVTIFDAPTPQRVIERLRPDVLIKGADWASGAIVGADLVRRRGGRVVRLPLRKGYSTTRLIARIAAAA
ncbi:MAG: D-glycero-beta-D-manno-heptose 1-phosphate adenylyltransferase [Candidatus Omnitrophica bacterium]|nr:D-glycero-beta-D-manno-heptose 1-phosphate adenylyltransferase [Candidatus Omnitrophota bacterium]